MNLYWPEFKDGAKLMPQGGKQVLGFMLALDSKTKSPWMRKEPGLVKCEKQLIAFLKSYRKEYDRAMKRIGAFLLNRELLAYYENLKFRWKDEPQQKVELRKLVRERFFGIVSDEAVQKLILKKEELTTKRIGKREPVKGIKDLTAIKVAIFIGGSSGTTARNYIKKLFETREEVTDQWDLVPCELGSKSLLDAFLRNAIELDDEAVDLVTNLSLVLKDMESSELRASLKKLLKQ